KPSQNFSLGDMPRGGLNERSFFQLADLNVVARTPEFFHRAANFLGIELRTPPGMIHHEFTRASENLMIYYECRADREARVTRRGLDVNAFERRRIEDAPVGHAVKGNAPGKAQVFFTSLGSQRAPVRRQDFFESRLHARGKIVMALGQ